MTQTATSIHDTTTLVNRLRDASYHRRLFIRLARVVRAASTWAAALLLVLLLDALTPTSSHVRATVAVVMLVGLLVVLLQFRLPVGERRRGERFEAWRLERWFSFAGNPLLCALSMRDAASPLGRALADRAVRRGNETMANLRYEQATDRGPIKQQLKVFAAVALVWLLLGALAPRLLFGNAARFTDPFGDHPPFSLTQFDVDYDPKPPTKGDDVTIAATLSGRMPTGPVQLVTLAADGRESARVPMRRYDDGTFRRVLSDVREPVTVYVATADGRSKRLRIEPKDPPQSRAANLPQADAGDESNKQGEPAGEPRDAAAEAESLRRKAEQLQAAAREARDRLEQVGQDREALREHFEQMNRTLQRYREQAKRLQQRLEAAGMQASAEDKALLDAIRRQIEKLQLADCPTCRLPGRAPDDQQVKQGPGMGGWSMSGNLGQWVQRVDAEATHDLKLLDEQTSALSQMVAKQAAATQTDADTKVGEIAEPDVAGAASHDLGAGGAHVDEGDAAMQAVPEAYRELVRQYFARVAAEQRNDNANGE